MQFNIDKYGVLYMLFRTTLMDLLVSVAHDWHGCSDLDVHMGFSWFSRRFCDRIIGAGCTIFTCLVSPIVQLFELIMYRDEPVVEISYWAFQRNPFRVVYVKCGGFIKDSYFFKLCPPIFELSTAAVTPLFAPWHPPVNDQRETKVD